MNRLHLIVTLTSTLLLCAPAHPEAGYLYLELGGNAVDGYTDQRQYENAIECWLFEYKAPEDSGGELTDGRIAIVKQIDQTSKHLLRALSYNSSASGRFHVVKRDPRSGTLAGQADILFEGQVDSYTFRVGEAEVDEGLPTNREELQIAVSMIDFVEPFAGGRQPTSTSRQSNRGEAVADLMPNFGGTRASESGSRQPLAERRTTDTRASSSSQTTRSIGPGGEISFDLGQPRYSMGWQHLSDALAPAADEKLLTLPFELRNDRAEPVELDRLQLQFSGTGERGELYDRKTPIYTTAQGAADDSSSASGSPTVVEASNIVLEPGQHRAFWVGLLLPGEADPRTLLVKARDQEAYQFMYPVEDIPAPGTFFEQPEAGQSAKPLATVSAKPGQPYPSRGLDIVVGVVLQRIDPTLVGEPDSQDHALLALPVRLINRSGNELGINAGFFQDSFVSDSTGKRHRALRLAQPEGSDRKARASGRIASGDSREFLLLFRLPQSSAPQDLVVSEGYGRIPRRGYRFELGKDIPVVTQVGDSLTSIASKLPEQASSPALGAFDPRTIQHVPEMPDLREDNASPHLRLRAKQ